MTNDEPPPDFPNGFTRIDNEIFDTLLSFPFTKRQFKIAMAVARKTYGWNKKSDNVSLSQLSNVTGIDPAHCSKAVNELSKMHVLLKRQGKYSHELEINGNYDQWEKLPKQQRVAKTALREGQNGNVAIAKTANTKDNPKRQLQKTVSQTEFDLLLFNRFWNMYPRKVKKKKSLEIWKRQKLDRLADQIIADVKKRSAVDQRWINGYIPDPTTYMNGERWNDEIDKKEVVTNRPVNDDYTKHREIAAEHGIPPPGVEESNTEFIKRVQDKLAVRAQA